MKPDIKNKASDFFIVKALSDMFTVYVLYIEQFQNLNPPLGMLRKIRFLSLIFIDE